MLENVKGIFSSGGTKDFGTILCELAALGYGIEYALCNSKNYGVPQHRERVFIVCDITGRSTGKIFPVGKQNSATIKQIFGGRQGERVYSVDGLSVTQSANGGGDGSNTGLYLMNKCEQEGIKFREYSNCIDVNYYKGLDCHQVRTGVLSTSKPRAVNVPQWVNKAQWGRRIKNPEEPMFTLTINDIHGIFQNARIRKLTPRETFRLQGVPDEYFDRAANVCSETQLYKQAGNGVTVPVVEAIGNRIMDIMNQENQNKS